MAGEPPPVTPLHDEAAQAFNTAAGQGYAEYTDLWLGMLFVFIFAWAAWVAVVAYKGWAAGDVSAGTFGGALLRVLVLFLITCAFFLS